MMREWIGSEKQISWAKEILDGVRCTLRTIETTESKAVKSAMIENLTRRILGGYYVSDSIDDAMTAFADEHPDAAFADEAAAEAEAWDRLFSEALKKIDTECSAKWWIEHRK